MKYVKCLYVEVGSRLTSNKIYEVFDYFIDNDGEYV